MNKIIVYFFAILMLSATGSLAGGGHSHGPGGSHAPAVKATEDQVRTNAIDLVQKLVEKNKIEKSWIGLQPATSKQRLTKAGFEWVVTFNNPKAEAEKQTLYIFQNLAGEYIAANFSGK